jgi:hypothetical protein
VRRTPDGRLAPPLPDRDHRLVVLIHRHTVGFRTGLDVGMALRHYGFERRPHGREVSATLGYSLSAHAFGLAGALDLTHENSPLFFRVSGMASDLQRPWFYGFGNQTPRGSPRISIGSPIGSTSLLPRSACAVSDGRSRRGRSSSTRPSEARGPL